MGEQYDAEGNATELLAGWDVPARLRSAIAAALTAAHAAGEKRGRDAAFEEAIEACGARASEHAAAFVTVLANRQRHAIREAEAEMCALAIRALKAGT